MNKLYTINNKREPLYLRPVERLNLCPDCKMVLWPNEAENDGAKCKCGVWWWTFPNPSITGNSDWGWHFKADSAPPVDVSKKEGEK